jgi:LCP family protein required for cell wall assembly
MSATAAPPTRRPDPPTRPPPGPPLVTPLEPRRRHPGLRLILGCLIVLICSAAASAVFVLNQVHALSDALRQNGALNLPSGTLAPTGWGDPETLLLVGDDQRALTKYYLHAVLPHSNEMLLVRIDPSKPYISMMSIPRELETTIYPSNAAPITTRFNYAYTAGGIPLLASTIKRDLGLSVNHVMVVTFARFKRAVDEMGCVYSTIDRRYYHVNTPTSEQYQEINLQPGYQKVCGSQALQFVSYRHGDTSLVRDARDQSFLLDVKKQYGPTLSDNIGKFEHIFGQAVQTDPGLQSTTGLLNLIGTLITSAGRRVRQVPFQVNLVPPTATPCACVTSSPQQIAASVSAFLHGGSPIPRRSTAAVARAVHNHKAAAKLPLVTTSAAALASAQTTAAKLSFTVEFPRVQDAGGSSQPVYLRNYAIHATNKAAYPAYVGVFSAGVLGQYYDVQGMSWTNAPEFASPGQVVHVGGRTYSLYYEGSKLEMVAWHEHGAAYWVRNSLNDSVANGEMLAIAEQTTALTGVRPQSSTGARRRLRAAALPAHPVTAATTTDLRQLIGSLAGLLALLVVPLLSIPLLRRRRVLAGLRAQISDSAIAQERLMATLGRRAR